MPRYRATIEYDGSNFSGWQTQRKDTSIQATLENALEIICRKNIGITGSGRTDAGVHALGQVVHFDLHEEADTHRLLHSWNGLLPDTIAVLDLRLTDSSFHARFDAQERVYRYQISSGPRALERHMRVHVAPTPDFDRMNAGAFFLTGEQNFSAFCRTRSETTNRACSVSYARWLEEQREGNWSFMIRADRFLHGMVRAIVGTLLQVGQGKREPEDLKRIIQSRDRRLAGPAAKARGLILERIQY